MCVNAPLYCSSYCIALDHLRPRAAAVRASCLLSCILLMHASLAAFQGCDIHGDAQARLSLAQVWDITEWAEAVGALPAYNTYANSHM